MKRFVVFPLQRLTIAHIEQIYPDHVKTICAYNKPALSSTMINEAQNFIILSSVIIILEKKNETYTCKISIFIFCHANITYF
jgi:hypothetical protein